MTNQIDALFNFKDASGTVNEIYPITKKENVQGLTELVNGCLSKSGGTMTGALMVDGNEDNIFYAMKVAKDKFLTGIQNNDKKERGTIEISPPAICLTIGSESVENYLNVTPAGIFTNKNIDIIQDNQLTTKEYVDSLKPKAKTVTLSSTGWTTSGDIYTQTVTISGVSATETEQEIHVTPATASMSTYMESGVYASGQAANQITFKASKVPTANLTVYVVIRTL